MLLERLSNFKEAVIDVKTSEKYITTEIIFMGNKIRHNTKSFKEFSNIISEDKNVVALRAPLKTYEKRYNRLKIS